MEYDKDILERTGIFVFNNALSPEVCKNIIKEFYDNPKEQFKGKTGAGYKPTLKNTTDYYIKGHNKYLLNNILKIALDKIIEARPGLKEYPLAANGFQFQKNEKGKGFFRWHSDYNLPDIESSRILAPIFYLNDVKEAGHTEFMYQKFSVKPEAGKLVIFPATWQYYHRGVTPKSEDKYIVTTFIIAPRGSVG